MELKGTLLNIFLSIFLFFLYSSNALAIVTSKYIPDLGYIQDDFECVKGDCDNGFGTCEYSGGGKYIGEWVNGYAHGKGSYFYHKGNTYHGEWKNGLRNGFGQYTSKLSIYIGYFKNSFKHGEGSETWPGNKELNYKGFYNEGNKISEDDFNKLNDFKKQNEYGCIEGNCENGYGVGTRKRDIYAGNWSNSEWNGNGILTEYRSEFKEDKNKSREYVGSFKNGMKHGKGKEISYEATRNSSTQLLELNGHTNICECEYRYGHRNGQGTLTYSNGDIYVGEFRLGEMHGHGTYIIASTGDKYVGDYVNGSETGRGTIYYGDGYTFTGEVKNGKMIYGTTTAHGRKCQIVNSKVTDCYSSSSSNNSSNVDWGAIIQFGFGMMNGSIGNNSISSGSSGSDSFDNIDSTFNSTSNAACACKCVNGKVKAICSNPNDLPPLCAPKLCPLVNQSIKPLDSPTLPPYGTSNCTNMQVYNPSTYQYEWEEICY